MLITADMGGGSATSEGHAPSSMTIEVDPDRLYATAKEFDATASNLLAWLSDHSAAAVFEPAGSDAVSLGISTFFHEAAAGDSGAFVRVQQAVKNLHAVATAMREAAASYGITDDSLAGNLAAGRQ